MSQRSLSLIQHLEHGLCRTALANSGSQAAPQPDSAATAAAEDGGLLELTAPCRLTSAERRLGALRYDVPLFALGARAFSGLGACMPLKTDITSTPDYDVDPFRLDCSELDAEQSEQ